MTSLRVPALLAALYCAVPPVLAQSGAVVPDPANDAAPIVQAARMESSWLNLDWLPFIPVPEIDAAPHNGVNVGFLPVILSTNSRGEVDQILAPDIIHSQYFGWGARWRIFRNPSDDEKWSLVAGAKQSVEREFDAEFDAGLLRDRDWSWSAHAMYDRSGTGRFFGLGNDTPRSNETTYIDSQIRLEYTLARNFTHALQLSYLMRADTSEIEQSALNSLPATVVRYPNQVGVGDVSELQQRVVLTYDTRDSVTIPRRGMRASAFAGFSTRALGSNVSYTYYGADASTYHPVTPDLNLVGHVAMRYMPTYTDAPFWALSNIGGDRSVVGEAQPLRGYGYARFIDRNSFSASIEARTWVKSLHVFSTDIRLELAPFVDTGKVFSSMTESPLSHLHVAGGIGFRMIASPFVVGYVDMGFGKEKLAIFTGIDYPF